ncbi:MULTISPECIES: hypothetical protein [Methylobacterium]|jgi:hypothetical protein|uniref:REase AHJR-like domain-containing protein n=1 Tax=Methylobacterium hispanicum TaxID=270350 RepID=A0AAV4ZQ70_9HYPH|nr:MULTISPECIES: hypothetical protein [Methylobacterium]GJD90026.1 hypothetical protein BHAOGJBA_3560 [Methylobacterium hispanicum]
MRSAQYSQEAERRFIETLRPHFENKGYHFHLYPGKSDLPEFMKQYTPDAVAVKTDHKVAIEVKSRNNRATDLSLRLIRHLFEGHPEWQLRVFYIGDDERDSVDIPQPTSKLFLEKLAMAGDLLAQGQTQAAFLISWSLLEAAARMTETDLNGRPQPPGTVIQTLAMSGTIEPETERHLRALIDLRNKVVHGDLGAEPTAQDVETILLVSRSIFEKNKSNN